MLSADQVLHWHIVDMPSFPFVSSTFPHLAAGGAFDQHHVYSPGDVAKVVAYAKARGTRVVPEFVRRLLNFDIPCQTFAGSNPHRSESWCDLIFHSNPRGGPPIIILIIIRIIWPASSARLQLGVLGHYVCNRLHPPTSILPLFSPFLCLCPIKT